MSENNVPASLATIITFIFVFSVLATITVFLAIFTLRFAWYTVMTLNIWTFFATVFSLLLFLLVLSILVKMIGR